LDLLINDLGGDAFWASWTFISDQQKVIPKTFDVLLQLFSTLTSCSMQILTLLFFICKRLLPAMQELLPRVDQRFCVRHLYENFRKQFPENI